MKTDFKVFLDLQISNNLHKFFLKKFLKPSIHQKEKIQKAEDMGQRLTKDLV